MDFARVLEDLARFLAERGHPFALIGALGLAAHGLARTTFDLDLIIDAAAQAELIAHLEALGYDTLHRSAGYSNHLHPDPELGQVDCVWVRGETSRELFARAQSREGPRGLEVPVPRAEHLAALKVVAMKNDPARTLAELADIRFLLGRPGVDREEIRGYFEKHGLLEHYHELEKNL